MGWRSLSVEQWLKCQWAMSPERCRFCGMTKSAAVYAEDGESGWFIGGWCPACCDPRERGSKIRKDIHWLIGEVRPVVAEVRSQFSYASESQTIVMWHRLGTWMDAGQVAASIESLRNLQRAREAHARYPGEWALELREDGLLWAPWCPIKQPWWVKRGEALPYRESTLAASRRKRECLLCKAPLSAGSKVWRPYKPGGTVRDADWPADAHHHACVCEPCARKVIAKGVQVGNEVVYGHLRVVGRETAG